MSLFPNLHVEHLQKVKEIGQRIKMERQKKNMTQIDLASKCNVEQSSLARIESGKTNPTIKSLLSIAAALEIDIKELF